ncbi:MurR/RpiR family transcriptional regulator [Sciscionella marina]|uniref:MurR/RpiR family transcriptional regulator n=1 Tax=Sciscionella marina TaxID=508770 RepID=UPI000373069D|nr:MurR/RpiR family transcriptional regulator [Sciscionella marina]
MAEDFAGRVADAAARLKPQERVVAEYLLAQPDQAVLASTSDIASATGTSDATVVRTARALGYSGLRELKKVLMAGVTDPPDPIRVLEGRIARSDSALGPVLGEVLTDAAALLARVPEELDERSWQRAVDLLDSAQKVWLYGFGPAGLVAEYHALAFSRLQRRAQAVTQTGFRLADPLMGIDRGDAVLIYAPLRRFHEIDVTIAHARRLGVPVILVTQALGAKLRDEVDVVLEVPSATVTMVSENLIDLLFAHALTLELARRDKVGSVTARQLLDQLRAEIVSGTTDDQPD